MKVLFVLIFLVQNAFSADEYCNGVNKTDFAGRQQYPNEVRLIDFAGRDQYANEVRTIDFAGHMQYPNEVRWVDFAGFNQYANEVRTLDFSGFVQYPNEVRLMDFAGRDQYSNEVRTLDFAGRVQYPNEVRYRNFAGNCQDADENIITCQETLRAVSKNKDGIGAVTIVNTETGAIEEIRGRVKIDDQTHVLTTVNREDGSFGDTQRVVQKIPMEGRFRTLIDTDNGEVNKVRMNCLLSN